MYEPLHAKAHGEKEVSPRNWMQWLIVALLSVIAIGQVAFCVQVSRLTSPTQHAEIVATKFLEGLQHQVGAKQGLQNLGVSILKDYISPELEWALSSSIFTGAFKSQLPYVLKSNVISDALLLLDVLDEKTTQDGFDDAIARLDAIACKFKADCDKTLIDPDTQTSFNQALVVLGMVRRVWPEPGTLASSEPNLVLADTPNWCDASDGNESSSLLGDAACLVASIRTQFQAQSWSSLAKRCMSLMSHLLQQRFSTDGYWETDYYDWYFVPPTDYTDDVLPNLRTINSICAKWA